MLLESIIAEVHHEEVRQSLQETNQVSLLPKKLVSPGHVVADTLISVTRGDGVGEDVCPHDNASGRYSL